MVREEASGGIDMLMWEQLDGPKQRWERQRGEAGESDQIQAAGQVQAEECAPMRDPRVGFRNSPDVRGGERPANRHLRVSTQVHTGSVGHAE